MTWTCMLWQISLQKMGSKSIQSSPLLLHPCSPRRLCGGGCGLVGDQVALVSVRLVSLAVWLLLDALVGFSATASTATPKWKMPQGGGGRCLKPQGGGGRSLKIRPLTLLLHTASPGPPWWDGPASNDLVLLLALSSHAAVALLS